jgi:hypothetical protein
MAGRESRSNDYNGWPSYETWLVFTWLTNDPVTYEDCTSLATSADDAHDAARALKDYIEEESPLVQEEASLYTDLVTAALGRVDWAALARHLRDDR